MQLLDGKKTAEDIKGEIAVEVQKMKNNGESTSFSCSKWVTMEQV
jgi:5,10-methylene-tetrahydrofolate dehydrogenase/methenyl tetrahydrofolate cyclohydrolase